MTTPEVSLLVQLTLSNQQNLRTFVLAAGYNHDQAPPPPENPNVLLANSNYPGVTQAELLEHYNRVKKWSSLDWPRGMDDLSHSTNALCVPNSAICRALYDAYSFYRNAAGSPPPRGWTFTQANLQAWMDSNNIPRQ